MEGRGEKGVGAIGRDLERRDVEEIGVGVNIVAGKAGRKGEKKEADKGWREKGRGLWKVVAD